jgi:hypothetical protein
MNGNSNILARLRRRKAGGALHAAVLLLAAQLSAALTPCFATAADGSAHVSHGVAAEALHDNHASHGDHANNVDHTSHVDHPSHVDHANHTSSPPDSDERQHCPHCSGDATDGHASQAGTSHACAAVEIVDTAPQASLDLAAKVAAKVAAKALYWTALPVAVHPPSQAAARASPLYAAPPVPSAVPLTIRHCVFLI